MLVSEFLNSQFHDRKILSSRSRADGFVYIRASIVSLLQQERLSTCACLENRLWKNGSIEEIHGISCLGILSFIDRGCHEYSPILKPGSRVAENGEFGRPNILHAPFHIFGERNRWTREENGIIKMSFRYPPFEYAIDSQLL